MAFTPGQVSLGPPVGFNPDGGGKDDRSPTSGGQIRPYLSLSGQPPNTLGAESVRASGSGPGDAAYRQNLATYEGGLFARPGGNLSFNPTGSLFGNPTGGGNAPIPGMPSGLLDFGLAGMGFTAPQQSTPTSDTSTTASDPTSNDNWRFWLNQFGQNGSMFNTL